MKRKILIICLALMTSVGTAFAQKVKIGVLYYELDSVSQTASVTYVNETTGSNYEYFGDIIIPESLIYNEETYSVARVGNHAFHGCHDLTSVEIPNSVTSIGEYAFSGCSSLTSVEIPNSVTSIGEYAFSDCSSLTSVTIGNSVTSIGEGAFYECSSLTSPVYNAHVFAYMPQSYSGAYTIPDGIESIAWGAFSNCRGLTSIEIPNSVTSIGESAFSGCSSLTSVEIPNSVTSIGESAFSGCSSLTSVEIPNSVTNIGAWAFSYCSSLTSVTIGNSVTSIGGSAFSGCSGLTSVTIGNSVTSIGEMAFYHCSSLTSPVYNAHVFAYMPQSYSGAYTIPDGIESIAWGAFSNCRGLRSIEIPNSVTYIGEYAFYNCIGLRSIEIPNNVTSIGEKAFYNCGGLTSIEIPNRVTNIGSSAFEGCYNISVVHWNAKNCNEYHFGQQVEIFTFGDEVEVIPGFICSGMNKLTSMSIPNSVISIGRSAFLNCTGLTSPVYNAHVFAYLPTSYSGAYTIPNGIESIAGGAFLSCQSLTSVTIPNSVTSIGNWAFSGCTNLTTIAIGNGVTYIGSSAFEYCSNLTSVIIEALTPPIVGHDLFYHTFNFSIYVPCGLLESYQSTQWANYNLQYRPNIYEFNVSSSDSLRGYTTSGGNVCSSTLAAFPYRGNNFVQWSDGVSENPRTITLTQDTTITAIFAPQIFTIRFVNENDTILSEQEYEYGATPVLPADPQKTGDAQYSYTFAGWSPRVVTVTKDATYKATYNATLNKYTITFMSDDSILSASLWEYGSLPIYPKGVPTKEEDENYTYTFDKWSPEIVPVVEDATYTATYTATPKSQGIEDIYGDSVERPVKYIENGDIYILMPNGKKYSIIGKLIK